jgi:hypothetical protein
MNASFEKYFLRSAHLPWCTPKLFDGLSCESKSENNRRRRSWDALLGLQHFGGRKACQSSEMGIKKINKHLGGSHHLPPYSILCAWPWDQYSNVILSLDSQNCDSRDFGGPITLCADLRLRWGLKQNCSPYQELSNDMWNATYKEKGRFSTFSGREPNCQLTLNPFFGHSLCLECLNGSCEPILNIYVPRTFPMI